MTKIKVLDHGFVELIDSMGSDQRVVDAARVSVSGGEVKPVSTNEGLIRYLMRMRHSTPTEMPQITFAVKCPIMVMRQLVRHRTASINEMSGRYGVIPDQFYVPSLERMNIQAKDNHQGSDEEIVNNSTVVQAKMRKANELAYEVYTDLLSTGLAKELARNVLPVSIYTQLYWHMDLRNLFHFLSLRRDGHAQYEIRMYAEAIWEIIQPMFPQSCQAWEDYVYNATTFSATEMAVLQELLNGNTDAASTIEMALSAREKLEFAKKIGNENREIIA